MIKISLLITTYNDPSRLKIALHHYLKHVPQPLEILICDDGSRSDTKKMLDSFIEKSKTPILHVYQDNRGWDAPGIRNLGAIKPRGDYLLMTDGDCVPHPKFINDHLLAAKKGYFVFGDRSHVLENHVDTFSTRFDILMNYILCKKIKKRIAAVRNPFERPKVYTRSSFSKIDPIARMAIACNFGVWKSDFMAINGFDESFRKWWPEDAECSARLLNSKLKLIKFRQKCLVYHLDHGQTSRVCHDEYRFAELSLKSGKTETDNGIKQRLNKLRLAEK